MRDRPALAELYGYTDFTWAVYGKLVEQLAPGRLTAPVEGSGWPSLAAALRHLLRVYDLWLHERFGAGQVVVANVEGVASWEALQDWRTKVRATMRRMLDSASDQELPDPRQADWRSSVHWRSSLKTPSDVVAHVLLHERGHHGDVSTLFFALGVAMPTTDYGVYLYFKGQSAP
ncbi:MAG: DinB family protein [Chloroflexi bacterium]|nr:DinB family protein [Chloroflexota bacterium]